MAELLKDVYTEAYVKELAGRLQEAHSGFDSSAFIQKVKGGDWPSMELKARMKRITEGIHEHVPLPYSNILDILIDIAPYCGSLAGLFLPDYVSRYGLDEDWNTSMEALARLTPFASAEFAVRPFILRDEERMMDQMLHWSNHESEHLRRLASEGCRPRLPWGQALKNFQANPAPILPILENLKDDPSEYVRRSVANNLNDISKDHPALVLEIAQRWLRQKLSRKRLVKHGLRTLLKKGDSSVLALFGFGNPDRVAVSSFTLDPKAVRIGDSAQLQVEMDIQGEKELPLRIEYAIDFVKKSGKLNRKVFQWKEKNYKGGLYRIEKSHSFRQMSTRKHYPGLHRLLFLVNGEEKAILHFELLQSEDSGL